MVKQSSWTCIMHGSHGRFMTASTSPQGYVMHAKRGGGGEETEERKENIIWKCMERRPHKYPDSTQRISKSKVQWGKRHLRHVMIFPADSGTPVDPFPPLPQNAHANTKIIPILWKNSTSRKANISDAFKRGTTEVIILVLLYMNLNHKVKFINLELMCFRGRRPSCSLALTLTRRGWNQEKEKERGRLSEPELYLIPKAFTSMP